MVVNYLESFMEDVLSNGTNIVDIRKLLTQENQFVDVKSNVMVVDASSLVIYFYLQLNTTHGGQLKELSLRIRKFTEEVQKYGARLIVHFEGLQTNDETLMTSNVRRLKRIRDTFRSPFNDDRGYKISTLYLVALKTFRRIQGCDVRFSVGNYHQEIVKCAREERALAVLAQDSDFLIYKGDFLYLSVKHLNLEEMVTVAYNRSELVDYLKIEEGELALLASLVGNDILDSQDLSPFYCKYLKIKKHDWFQLYYMITEFVKEVPTVNMSETITYFKKDNNLSSLFKSAVIDALKLSLEKYRCQRKEPIIPPDFYFWEELIHLARKKHCHSILPSSVFSVIGYLFYSNPFDLEYKTERNVPSIIKELQPLRQNIYGILLHEKPAAHLCFVNEAWVEERKNEEYGIRLEKVSVQQPSQHVGLRQMWEESTTKDFIKWTMFCNAVGPQLRPSKLRELEPRLIIPTVALFYLYNQIQVKFLKEWEMEAFIIQLVQVDSFNLDTFPRFEKKKVPDRAIQLARVFNRTCEEIEFLNGACGTLIREEDSCPSRYFDDLLFNFVYFKMKTNNCTVYDFGLSETLVRQYGYIRRIILYIK